MDLPKPQHSLVERINYVVSDWQVVSLCVVDTHKQREVRLYRWQRDREQGWKVTLARIPAADINLRQMAEDTVALAEKYRLPLSWGSTGHAVKASSLGAAASPKRSCPNCGQAEGVRPLGYGEEKAHPDSDVVLVSGCFSAVAPLWGCSKCNCRWGTLAGD